jgi:hypothetical protein
MSMFEFFQHGPFLFQKLFLYPDDWRRCKSGTYDHTYTNLQSEQVPDLTQERRT